MTTRLVESTDKDVLSRILEIPVERITQEADVEDDLGADWLAMVEIQMALEDEFGIPIPDAEAERLRTVGGAIEWIEEHLA